MSFINSGYFKEKPSRKFIFINIVIGLSISISLAYWGYFKKEIRSVERGEYQIKNMISEKQHKQLKITSSQHLFEDHKVMKSNITGEGTFFVKPEMAFKQLDQLFGAASPNMSYLSITHSDDDEFYYDWKIQLKWSNSLKKIFELSAVLSKSFKIKVDKIKCENSLKSKCSVLVQLNFISDVNDDENILNNMLLVYGLNKDVK